MRWRWLIIVVILAAAGAGGYYWYQRNQAASKAQSQYQTVPVTRGNLVVTVAAAGNVAADRQMNLSFSSSGKVTKVYVQAGDVVTATNPLMEIDTTDLQASVAQATLSLATAEAQLKKLSIGSTQADIASAQAAVKSAEENLANVKAGATPDQLASAKATLANAQQSLDSLTTGPTDIDLQLAQLSVDQAKNSLWSAQGSRDATLGSSNASGGAKTSAKASVANAELAVQTAELNLQKLQLPSTPAQVAAARAQVAAAQESLKKLEQGATPAEIATAEAQVAQAQANLDTLMQGPTAEDVAIAQAQVDQARLTLQQAQQQLQDAVLLAPFNGTVLSVAVNPGDEEGAGTPVVVLADLSALEVQCSVSELDIGRLAQGQSAVVQIDALSSVNLRGHVSQLAPAATISQGVANYPLTVALDQADPRVRPGMSASLTITADRRQNVLLVPNRAVRTQGANRVVAVPEGDTVKWVQVTIGASNDTMTEIVSGLTEGQLVVTNPPNPTQGRGGFPGGGFGGPGFIGR